MDALSLTPSHVKCMLHVKPPEAEPPFSEYFSVSSITASTIGHNIPRGLSFISCRRGSNLQKETAHLTPVLSTRLYHCHSAKTNIFNFSIGGGVEVQCQCLEVFDRLQNLNFNTIPIRCDVRLSACMFTLLH